MTSTRFARRPPLAATLLLAVALVACTADGSASDSLEVAGAWARTSPAVVTAGAVYLEIANDTDAADALADVSVDAAVAGTAELHETVAALPSDGGMGMESTGAGMMEMREVDEIPVPAGETVALEPGGYHIMLLDLAEPLELGGEIDVTLVFEEAGEIVVTAEIRESAP
jgi:hypothetical protein